MVETISVSLDNGTATKLRIIAEKENRSVSNVVASAVALFVDLPKEFRDLMLELHSSDDQASIRNLGREIMLAATRTKFENATTELAAEARFGGPDGVSSEFEIYGEATRLTRETLKTSR